MYWHHRHDAIPAPCWLRSKITRSLAEQFPEKQEKLTLSCDLNTPLSLD